MIARTPAWWGAFVVPRSEKPEDGFTRRQYVEYSGHSGLEGYANYAVRAGSAEGIARGSLRLHELAATNPAAEAALWRYVFGVDLVETIEAHNRPTRRPSGGERRLRRLRRLRLDPVRRPGGRTRALAAPSTSACAEPARAGRIEGSPEALRLADALFAWHTAPWCADQF